MLRSFRISDVRFITASSGERSGGLIGWVSFKLNDHIRLDGVAVRRTADGRLALSFPARRDGAGRQHFYVRPLDDQARRDIERQVFAALGFEEGSPR